MSTQPHQPLSAIDIEKKLSRHFEALLNEGSSSNEFLEDYFLPIDDSDSQELDLLAWASREENEGQERQTLRSEDGGGDRRGGSGVASQRLDSSFPPNTNRGNCLFYFLRIARKDAKKFKVGFNLFCF